MSAPNNTDRILSLKHKIDAINSVSSSFCLAKWLQSTTTLYNGYTHSCHHPTAHKINVNDIKKNPKGLHNTPIKIAARQDMLNGIQTKECDYCWNIENLGQDHFSDRHYKSANQGMGIWQGFDNVIKSGLGEEIAPAYLEVAFENVCNFKCSYCSPDVSSRWMEEVQEHGGYKLANGETHHDIEWMKKIGKFPIHHKEQNPYIDAFWEWWPELYQSLDTFRITGGEPLLSDNTWKILDYVIANPRKDFKIGINTNMCVPKKIIEKLCMKLNQLHGKIREVVIFTSAESTNEWAEYSRFGMDWQLFKQNIDFFLDNTPPSVRMQFMTTVNILSASSFDYFLMFVSELRRVYGGKRERNRIGFNVAYLRWPRHQSITLLDKEQKRIFTKKMNEVIEKLSRGGHEHFIQNLYLEEIDQINRLVNFMNSVEPDQEQLDSFVTFFDEYDRRRKTSLLDTFPELGETYKSGKASQYHRLKAGADKLNLIGQQMSTLSARMDEIENQMQVKGLTQSEKDNLQNQMAAAEAQMTDYQRQVEK